MIAKTEILRTLRMIDVAFRSETSNRKCLLLAKQALLELCGWIEESMDDVCLRYVRSKLKERVNFNHFKNEHVRTTYGFQYKGHFRQMLISSIGIVGLERLEKAVDPVKRDALKSRLGSLKDPRNTHAHTHIKDTTPTINAPSRTIQDFEVIYEGLLEYQNVIRSKKFK